LDRRSIKRIASVDIKKDEKAIIDAAKHFNCSLIFFDKNELQEVENKFEVSDFVKKNVGVGSVCEPAAFLAGNKKGKFFLKKEIYKGITIAIFEEEVV
jgi:cobalt-precorrin 5A hydrolase